jgi:hypothetical protein
MPSVQGYFGSISMDQLPDLWVPLPEIAVHTYPSLPDKVLSTIAV